jgi:UDPglucose 6-dehydrogenase
MQICVVGAGYVGLVTGACLSDLGHSVTIVDKEASRIARLAAGDIPLHEPGLQALIAKNTARRRLAFTTAIRAAVAAADVIFIAVGTPSRAEDGVADLTNVYSVADQIAAAAGPGTVVVCKSTVPVGTNRKLLRRMRNARPSARIEVGSNPEFLREGSAVADFLAPDRIVIGSTGERARDLLAAIYAPLAAKQIPVLFTGLETAELIKYAANAFLATKLSFINEIADLCESAGADVAEVARGIGLDPRIGAQYLAAGPGFGGSCLPKDTRALVRSAGGSGVALRIVEAVVAANTARKNAMAARIAGALGGSARGKTVAILGLTFKADTDDLRESPALSIIPALQRMGVVIRAHDPQAMAEAARHLGDVKWCDGPYHAAEGADAVAIVTEWDAYRMMDLDRLRKAMRGDCLVDLRNVCDPRAATAAGFVHHRIGHGVPPDSGSDRDDDEAADGDRVAIGTVGVAAG